MLFLITLGNFVLAFPLRPLAAMPSACRRFLAPGLAGLVQALLNVGLTLLLLHMGGKATALTWLAFALNLGLMLWQTHYAVRTLGHAFCSANRIYGSIGACFPFRSG